MAKPSFKVESGIQLLARLNKKPSTFLFNPHLFQSGLKPGEVVEIIYNESTPMSLLDDLISTALLPTDYGGTGGTGVLIFNCSGNVNFNTLIKYMGKKIQLSNETFSEDQVNHIIENKFVNLFSVDVHDATQYYTTLYNLENVLFENTNISMILIDNIAAFYWSEQGHKIMRMDSYLKKNLSIIQNVVKEHKVVVFYLRPDYFYSGKDVTNSLESFKEYSNMCGVNYRINVLFESDKKYHAHVLSNKMQLVKQFCTNEDLITWC